MPVDIDPGREMRDRTGERALQPLPHGVAPGARVTLRGQTWRLAGYEPHDDCGELRLQPHARPGALVLLWPFDRPCVERTEGRWRIVRPRRWLRSVAAIAARDCRTPHLRARAAAAAILPYQLAPALSIAAGESRILLADEVGLGKTAQAGWIVSDLLERRPDCRVLVAVPAGVRIQWTRELKRLFWIESRSVDARWLLNEVNALPPGITPWTPPGVYVASADFIKRPDVAASMNGHSWDLLIVDEAHTAAAPTERYQALEALARRSRCVVLITATPFSGDDAGFASLDEGRVDDPWGTAVLRP